MMATDYSKDLYWDGQCSPGITQASDPRGNQLSAQTTLYKQVRYTEPHSASEEEKRPARIEFPDAKD